MRETDIQTHSRNTDDLRGPETETSAQDNSIDTRQILRRLFGYKWTLASIAVLFVGLTWVILEQIAPRYIATAVVLINPPKTNVLNMTEVVEGLDTTPETVGGEVIVLKSRELVSKTAERIDIFGSVRSMGWTKEDGQFEHLNPLNYVPEELRLAVTEFWRRVEASILGRSLPPNASSEQREALTRHNIVDRFLGRLTVEEVPDTRAITVSFSLEDPQLAADAANTLAELYVANTLEVKSAGTRQASLWLAAQLDQLRQKVEDSESQVERFRKGEALIEGRSMQLVSDQITALNTELVDTKSEIAQLSARLREIEELEVPSDWDRINGTLINSTIIDALQIQRLELEREVADRSSEYGSKHPKILSIMSMIEDVNERIRREISNRVRNVENRLAVAKDRESSLAALIHKLTNEVGGLNEVGARLQALERESEANRRIYETFLTRYKEASVQIETQEPDARIVSYAEVPNISTYPPRMKILYGSLVLSVGLGLVLVYTLEAFSGGFRSVRQLEQASGLPVVGLTPEVPLNKRKLRHLANYVVEMPNSRLSECLGSIFANSIWFHDQNLTKCLVITSAISGEGKTSTCAALARRAALLGENVILLDCDLRHPKLHGQLGLKSTPGISDVVSGCATLEESVQEDTKSGLKFLACGSHVKDPIGMLRSPNMEQLVEQLKESYALTILDSPPFLAAVDAQLLAQLADQCLILTRWGKTKREATLAAIQQLDGAGVGVRGLVLTRVDMKTQSYYGYGEYGYYTSQMQKYYTGSH